MFNPSWLRSNSQEDEANKLEEQDDASKYSSNVEANQASNPSPRFYPPNVPIILTPNGPMALPVHSLGYPSQSVPWMMPGQYPQLPYQYFNYYQHPGLLHHAQNHMTSSNPSMFIDPSTGSICQRSDASQQKPSQPVNRNSDPKPYKSSGKYNYAKPNKHQNSRGNHNVESFTQDLNEPVIEEKMSLTGLINPIFNTPEEIEKWKAARRRNFPTRENIQKKQEELVKNGELGKINESELSRLEVKLRKKLLIMQYDPIEEKRVNKVKKNILHKINSARRYRTGLHRTKFNEKEEEDNELEKEAQQQNKIMPSANRERSRNSSKAQHRIKMKQQEKSGVPIDKKNPPSTTNQVMNNIEGKNETSETQAPKKQNKSHTAAEIIEHLKSRRQEDDELVNNFLTDKKASDKFKYLQNNLLSNLLLEDVFKERNIMLQSLRYLVKHNFLQTIC